MAVLTELATIRTPKKDTMWAGDGGGEDGQPEGTGQVRDRHDDREKAMGRDLQKLFGAGEGV